MGRLNSYYYLFRYKALNSYWDYCAKYSKMDGIVLMFHHITDKQVDINESCQHKIKLFGEILLQLQSEGYEFISIEKVLDFIENRNHTKFALVTFDDVPEDVYFNAYPIMNRMQVPFTLFLTTNYIGKLGYLNEKQILEMDNNSLCTIGAHTISHPILRQVDNCFYELSESKKILERLLNHSVDYLAYPFGRQSSISHKVMSEARRVGYKCAFGTIQSKISDVSSKSKFYLPRIVIK